MKTRSLSVALCLAAAFIVTLGGCRKKPKEQDTNAPQPESSVSISEFGRNAMDKAAEMKDQAVAKVLDIAQQFQDDQNAGIPEIAARAKEMAVENLRKMAEKYRDTIAEQQQKLKVLTEKLIALPDAEKDGPPAQNLKATIEGIYKGLAPLKERFQVYYNALKEKAGDLTGLEI